MSFRTVLYSVLTVTLAAHVFFYFSLVRFFGIENTRYRRVLATVLGLLAVSYLPAHLLSHHYENILVRLFDLAAGLWLGVFFHLFAASMFGMLFLYISGRVGFKARPAIVGAAVLSLGVLISGYGVWNAFNPRITDVTVSIKGLPENLEGMTVVQISDVHLGQVHGQGFMQKVVDLANLAYPDAVFITGDLFDGGDGEMYELAKPLKGLEAPMGVYFVNGNHDRHTDGERINSILARLGVRVLDDEVVDLGGLQVVGVSYRRWGANVEPANAVGAIDGFDPFMPNILLCHSPGGEKELAENAAAGIDLQLSGHTHRGQIFPFGYITSYVYNGYDYGLYRVGDMAVYVTDGAGSWGPPMRTGTPPEIVRITLTGR